MSPVAAAFLLVIPAYREARRLPPFLRELRSTLADFAPGVDILVVDDGSPPADWQALRTVLAAELGAPPTPPPATTPAAAPASTPTTAPAGRCRLLPPLRLEENTCKGGAILAGWRQPGPARWLAFVDADGAVSAREVRRLFTTISATSDVAEADRVSTIPIAGTGAHTGAPGAWFASRAPHDDAANRPAGIPSNPQVSRTPLRRLSAALFAAVTRLLIGVSAGDTQCGFKIVTASAYRRISADLRPHGFCLDLALLLALRRADITVRVEPIAWHEQPDGHLNLRRHGAGILRELLALRREERAARVASR